MGRRGDRQPKLSNIAADYCVNQDLIEQRIGEKISVVPILFDAKFKGNKKEQEKYMEELGKAWDDYKKEHGIVTKKSNYGKK